MQENKLSKRTVEILKDSIDKTFSTLEDDGLKGDIEEECLKVLKKIYESGSYHGKKTESLVGSVIYICSSKFVAVQPDEVVESLDIEKDELFGTTRYIMRETDIEVNLATPPSSYVKKFSRQMGLGDELEDEAIEICKMTEEEHSISGRSPTGLAASSLYLASERNGGDLTQRQLSNVCGKSEVTIRKNYKKQVDLFDE